MFKSEADLRGAAWGVSNGFLVGALASAFIENTEGYYWWQLHTIAWEFFIGGVLTIALVASAPRSGK